MSTLIGALRVTLGLDAAAFTQGLTESQKNFNATTRRFEQLGKTMTGIGTKLSVAVTAPLALLGQQSMQAAIESREAMAQVESALKSMGPVAGYTADQLSDMAAALQATSTFDDDEVLQKVTANLLTFGNVQGTVFAKAQQAAVDLSARLGQDLQSSTIMLGKALNDPVKGLTALSRVGVSFTAQQTEQVKAMAKAGDLAGAQALILGELEKQYGGAAQAMRDAAPGSDTVDAWRNFQESIGEIGLKLLPPLTDMLTAVLESFNNLSPGTQETIVKFAAVAAAAGPVLIGMGSLAGALANLRTASQLLGPDMLKLSKTLLGLLANPVILGAALVIGGIYLAWKNWDKIKAIVSDLATAVTNWWKANVSPVFNAVKTALGIVAQAWLDLPVTVLDAMYKLVTGVRGWLLTKLNAVWEWVIGKIEAVKKAFFNLYDAVVGHSYVPDMVDGIAAQMKRLDGVMVDPANKATSKAAEAFRTLAQDVQGLLADLFPESTALNAYRRDMTLLEEAAKKGLVTADMVEEAKRRLAGLQPGEGLNPDLKENLDNPWVPEWVTEQARESIEKFNDELFKSADKTAEANKTIAESFRDMATQAASSLRGLVDAIKKGDVLGIIGNVAKVLGQIIGGKTGGILTDIGGALSGGIQGFASGTASAPRGLALVGEQGPELVRFRGGERVFPAGETRRMLGGSAVTNNYYTLPSDQFWSQVDRRAGGVVAQAAPALVSAGGQAGVERMRRMQSRALA